MWSKGFYNGYYFEVKHYDEPSEIYGYRQGRMSKIYIRKGNKVTFNYDRGLDIDAQDKGTIEVLDYLMTIYG